MNTILQLFDTFNTWLMSLGFEVHMSMLAVGLALIIFSVVALLVQRIFGAAKPVDHAARPQKSRPSRIAAVRRADPFLSRLDKMT